MVIQFFGYFIDMSEISFQAANKVASHADSLRDSSRVPPPRARGGETRDESLRESAWEARNKV